jgi:peptidyl-prolyl cis-trans isomerase A (cyclophilin A)
MAIKLFIVVALLQSSHAFAGTLVQFRTTVGDIAFELYDREKPVTVQNFLRYVANGAYSDCLFHRGVGGFVIQGGGYRIRDRASLTNYSVLAVATFPPITNEFGVGPMYSNTYGTIAMAKTSDPNSATSQFFINLANNSALDNTNNSGGFTVFGRVIDGTNALNRLNVAHPSSAISIVNAGGVFAELPVLKSFSGPTIESDELVYVDVTALTIAIETTDAGARLISWNSVSNLINRIEYSTNQPPVWRTLMSTNGNGGWMQHLDGSGTNQWRLYRVRVGE